MGVFRLRQRKALLDPRTKLALLVVLAAFCLGGAGGERLAPFRALMSLLPFVLLLVDGKRAYGLVLLAVLLICNAYGMFVFTGEGGAVEGIATVITSVATRLIPCMALSAYAMGSTSVSEFSAAMGRLRVPKEITIPMSVMFRFFPTIRENAANIQQAMAMRGIRGANVGKFIEYRVVPLVECTTRSADDLGASALIRGLGGPVHRTDIARIGFGAGDATVLLAVAACLLLSLVVTA